MVFASDNAAEVIRPIPAHEPATELSSVSVYVRGVTRFIVDRETLLRIAAGEIEVSAEHQLVAQTLVRSQALSALYEARPAPHL